MIALLLVLGAVTAPDVTIDSVKLLPAEASWLLGARVIHAQELKRKMDNLNEVILKINEEVAELAADAAALPEGAEKTAMLEQIATIEAGQVQRGKVAAKEIKRAVEPTPAKARKRTIAQVYNGTIINPAIDANSNGTLSRGETGWPVWLFNLVDTDASGQATGAEFAAYAATL